MLNANLKMVILKLNKPNRIYRKIYIEAQFYSNHFDNYSLNQEAFDVPNRVI